MARFTIIRLGAYAAVAAPVLAVATLVAFIVSVGGGEISDAAGSTSFYVAGGCLLLATTLLAPALVALYLDQEERLGSFGAIAFLVALVGTVLAAGGAWSYPFVLPRFADAVPDLVNEGAGSVLAGFLISYFVAAVGWLMFGLATMRVRAYPRWASLLLVAGAAVAFLPLPSRTLVLSIAVGYLGSRLLRERSPAVAPARAVGTL